MSYLISYLTESTVCILLLFMFYKLALSPLTFFQWRRFYLLAGIGLSLVIPVVTMEISLFGSDSPMLYPMEMMAEFEGNLKVGIFPEHGNTTVDEKGASYWLWGWYLAFTCYFGVVIWLLFKLVVKLSSIIRRGKNDTCQDLGTYKIIESDQIHIPYTFLNNIFLPKGQLLNPREYDFVLEHEKVHVFQKHSLDIIFISFVKVFFWFNPVYKLILKEIKLLHEYIADDHVNKLSSAPVDYGRLLLKLAMPGSKNSLVINFSKLQIKERIIMLKKKKTQPRSKMRFLLVIPLVVFLIFAFSVKRKPASKKSLERMERTLISNVLLPGLIITQNTKPSGWPLDNRFHRISSGFGMREHPIDKVKKMHRGIDFPAPFGTPVYATGDGVVTMVKTSPDGYGKYVRIKHGEYETVYAQLSSFDVKIGEIVLRGKVIGHVGSSGASTAPHLHYEVLKNGKPVDPEKTFC